VRIELEYMIVGRARCPVAIGRRNFLFGGSDDGEIGGQRTLRGYLLHNAE
jgi:hypothetical protein